MGRARRAVGRTDQRSALLRCADRRLEVTVQDMPEMPTVVLRTRTDDDLDVLFSIAADLDTWEERNPWAPGPLTRERFNARLARAADTDAAEANVSFVVDVD